LALIFSSLAFFITPSVASAATSASGLGNYEASYCKNEPNPGDCETALSQGFNDANSSKNNKTSYCNQYAPNTSGRVGAIGGTPNYGPEQSCSYGYQQGQDKVGGLSYCSDYTASAFNGCMTIFYAGYGASSDNSSSYCKNPPGSISTATCATIYKAGYGKTDVGKSTPTPVGGSGGGTPSPTCYSSGWNLSWMVCPIVNSLADLSDDMYNALIVPLLQYKPINLTDTQNDKTHTYEVWSQFRIYGDVFLVLALLAVVFGESIGGGLIDAYTAKKVLPRLLVAAILINISIYLVAIAVDVSNILGKGIEALIEYPFRSSPACTQAQATQCLHFSLNPGTSDTIGIIGLLGVGGTIWGLLGHTAGTVALGGDFLALIGFAVVIPAIFTFFAILTTLIVRQGLIMFLIFVSPVAFALYTLPNTERYFKQWWDWLLRALLVYPIIGATFAIANVMSLTISYSTTGLKRSLLSLLSIFVMFIPLIAIPYSIRLAGGLIARTHDAVTGVRDKAHQGAQGKLRAEGSWYANRQQERAHRVADWKADTLDRGLAKSGVSGFALRTVGGKRAKDRQAQMNAHSAKALDDLSASGDDSLARASTMYAAMQDGSLKVDGRYNAKTGKYISSTGQEFTEAQIKAGHARWGHTRGDQQAAFKLMMGKTLNESPEYQEYVAQDFASWANDEHMDTGAAKGAWAGVAIPNQRMRGDLRHATFNGDPGKLSFHKSDAGQLDMLGTESGFSLASQQEGFFESSVPAIQAQRAAFVAARQEKIAATRSGDTDAEDKAQEEMDRIRNRMANAYGNLDKFVGQDSTGPKVPPIVNPDGTVVPGTGSSYGGGSTSASWKTEQAARRARDEIKAQFGDLTRVQDPNSGGSISRADNR
jgi:hypothetical protein